MSRDFTLFQFDLDEDTVRSLLSSIPGVTPLSPAGEGVADDDGASPGEPGRDEETTDGTESTAGGGGVAGAEAHAADSPSPTDEPPTGETRGEPFTPWPGAPTNDRPDESGGLVSRLGGKKVLLAVGAVLGLGVIGVAAVWFLERRNGDESDPAGNEAVESGDRPETSEEVGGPGAESRSGPDETDASATGDDSHSYPIDPAPIVGIAFLAVGSLVLRHVRSSEDAGD